MKSCLLAFTLKPEEVPDHVPRQRKLFGQPEVIGKVRPVYRQLLELGIGLKTGILTKKHQTKYLIIDTATGKTVDLERRLALEPGIEHLLGLDSRDVEVLRNLSDHKYYSAVDVDDRMKLSLDTARKSLQELEHGRFVKSSHMGRVRVYCRITNIPSLDLKEAPLNLSP